MKINGQNLEELKQKAQKILNETEDKSVAISQVVDMFVTEKNKGLIEELQKQSLKASSDKDYANKLGLRVLSEKEEKFYEKFKNPRQSFTGNQIDHIPVSVIDLTMENVKKDEPVLKLINMAPTDVKRWIIAEKSGVYSWEGLTEKLKGEISAGVDSLITDLAKLDAYIIIPKAISELSYPFIDKYFMAILNQILREGLAYGYLNGNGKNQPIGSYKQIDKTNEDGTHQDKTLNTDLTNFSPKGLAKAKVYLTNNGLRVLDKLYLVCNPEDEANYVAPALYDREGNLISSYKNLEVVQCTENPKGKAMLTLAGKYTMAVNSFQITKYEETLALDDADVLIGKAYANGRAVADNVAYVFDVTKLEEYIPVVKTFSNTVQSTTETNKPQTNPEEA